MGFLEAQFCDKNVEMLIRNECIKYAIFTIPKKKVRNHRYGEQIHRNGTSFRATIQITTEYREKFGQGR